MFDPCITRWDANHTNYLEIGYSQDSIGTDVVDEDIRNDVEYFGVEVYTTVGSVADHFGAETFTRKRILVKEVEARRNGDRVYYLRFGEHSAYAFDITRTPACSDWDSCCCGILVVRRARWPETVYVDGYVFKKIQEAFTDRVMAALNGWIYELEATVDGKSTTYSGLISEEDALEIAAAEFPAIKYAPDDFEEETVWRLVA